MHTLLLTCVQMEFLWRTVREDEDSEHEQKEHDKHKHGKAEACATRR